MSDEHRLEICEAFLDGKPYAACSCGWEGEKRDSREEALRDRDRHHDEVVPPPGRERP